MKMSKGVVIFTIMAVLIGVFGLIDGIPTLKMIITDSETLVKEISEKGTSKMYFCLHFIISIFIAAMILFAGIGILFRKNWARKLIILSAIIYIFYGSCGFIHDIISFKERGLLTGTILGLQIYASLFGIIIMSSFIIFFTRQNVKKQFTENMI